MGTKNFYSKEACIEMRIRPLRIPYQDKIIVRYEPCDGLIEHHGKSVRRTDYLVEQLGLDTWNLIFSRFKRGASRSLDASASSDFIKLTDRVVHLVKTNNHAEIEKMATTGSASRGSV